MNSNWFRFSFVPTMLVGGILLSGTLSAQKIAVSDAQVQANVLRSLAGEAKLSEQAITTSTVFGTVTLTGAVTDNSARDLAENVVSHTAGVKKVVDQLQVGHDAVSSAQQQAAQVQQQQPATGQPQGDDQNAQMERDGQEALSEPDQAGAPGQDPYPPHRLYRRDYERQLAQQNAQAPQSYGQEGYSQPQAQGYASQQVGRPGGVKVQIPAGTVVNVRLNRWLTSDHVQAGTGFDGFVTNDVVGGGEIALPRGAVVQGTVVDVHQAGALKGKGSITLQLESVQMGGRTYPLQSEPWTVDGRDKTGQTVGSTAFGAIFGALIGGAVGGGAGAGAGAAIGGAAGLGTSAIAGGGQAVIPGEAVVDFRLSAPSQVVTVSEAEMQRLGSYAGPASDYARGPAQGYGPGYAPVYGAPYAGYAPYPYGYPAVGIGVGFGYPYYGGYYRRPFYRGYYGRYGRRY